MIIENVGIIVAPQKREELRRALSSMLGPTEAEAGCVSCHLYQESSNANAFRFEAHWRCQNDLAQHMRAYKYRNLLVLMEMGVEPPTIEFHVVSETRGLDLIQNIRSPQEPTGEENSENAKEKCEP